MNSLPNITEAHPEDTRPKFIEGCVQNFSSVVLNEKEILLLNKGLKFCIPLVKPSIENLIVAAAEGLEKEGRGEVSTFALSTLRKIKTNTKTDKSFRINHDCKSPERNYPIDISKADKSNKVVILDEKEYDGWNVAAKPFTISCQQ